MTDEQKQLGGNRPGTGHQSGMFSRGPSRGGRGGDRQRSGRGGGNRRGGKPSFFEKPEFDQKIIDTKRVARVMSGGRRFNFKVVIVVGDRNGRVGVGTGKGGDTALAIEKAFRAAKRNIIAVERTKEGSIPHEVSTKYSSARVRIMPAPGRGLIAGSSLRVVLDLAGVRDVVAKVISPSKNKLNIARAAVQALQTVSPAKKKKEVAVVAPAV